MKSFKDYLTESKRVYEFKVKIAGECPKDCTARIKAALSPFQVESCSAGKRTPIQERQEDFPGQSNISMTIFDVKTSYPATSMQVRDAIAAKSGVGIGSVCVRNLAEEAEIAINHAHDKATGEALLGTEYATENNQDTVGEKHAMSFLKTLNKDPRTTGEAVTGTNDALLTTSAPADKASFEAANKKGTVSAIGSKATKLPDPYQGR